MMRRPLGIVLLGLLPMAVVPALLANLSDRAARSTAVVLDGVARSVFATNPAEPRWTYVEPLAVAEPEAQPTKGATRRMPARGIRVGRAAVLRIASSGQQPTGIPVPARGARPAGLALAGVSGLGIGLQDGDILVQAAGRPTLRSGDVVGVVLGSRAHRAAEISGRFYRNGEPWNLIVEQPYVDRRTMTERVALAR